MKSCYYCGTDKELVKAQVPIGEIVHVCTHCLLELLCL